MKNLIKMYCFCAFVLGILASCQESAKPQADSKSKPAEEPTTLPVHPTKKYPAAFDFDIDDEGSDEDFSGEIADGSYEASVDYYNPNTGYSATYTLTVEVSDGQIVQIDFPNDGYLDDDHISAADIDENGDAKVAGEDGKTYDVHISL